MHLLGDKFHSPFLAVIRLSYSPFFPFSLFLGITERGKTTVLELPKLDLELLRGKTKPVVKDAGAADGHLRGDVRFRDCSDQTSILEIPSFF